jgi:hypothetical protein
MPNIAEQKYEAAIPSCCRFKTLDEHRDNLALCWSLLAAINDDTPMDCGMCEFADRIIIAKEI